MAAQRAPVRLCWCCLVLVWLQPCATFHGAVPAITRGGRSFFAALAARADAGGVDPARRQFVVGSSLLLGGSLVAAPGLCSAMDATDAEQGEEEHSGGDELPTWAVDIEVPAYAADKAWMWRDLREGNIVKANTKLAAEDIYYPKWMFGLWQVESTTRCVEAPLGEELFGRAGALQEARKDVDVPLKYQARFRRGTRGQIIADRAFNVDSISRAAMGDSAVLECFLEDGNADRLKMTLVPSGAGGRVFDALLYVTSRDQSRVSEVVEGFSCSETSHQTVIAQNDPLRGNVGAGTVSIPRSPSTSVKDIQVIQVFNREDPRDPSPSSFSSVQRISTFMTEDEFRDKLRAKKFQGPGTAQKFSEIKKMPVDVRVYDIQYTLLRRPRSAVKPEAQPEPSDEDE
jgi:hypothetical protein